jgi:hypothetical protein
MPLPKRPVLLGGDWKLNTILIALLTALNIAALTANSGRQIIEPSTVATVSEPEQFNRSYAFEQPAGHVKTRPVPTPQRSRHT